MLGLMKNRRGIYVKEYEVIEVNWGKQQVLVVGILLGIFLSSEIIMLLSSRYR